MQYVFVFIYQLWHVVDDDQVRPRVGGIKVALIVHTAQLTDSGEGGSTIFTHVLYEQVIKL